MARKTVPVWVAFSRSRRICGEWSRWYAIEAGTERGELNLDSWRELGWQIRVVRVEVPVPQDGRKR